MKKSVKISIIVLCCVIVVISTIIIVAYNLLPVITDVNTSSIYTASEIEDAMKIVKKEFVQFEQCKLISLAFAGDEECKKEKERHNNSETKYDNYLVIKSVFLSPFSPKGAWNPHEIYTWKFILAKNEGEAWTLINYGYA